MQRNRINSLLRWTMRINEFKKKMPKLWKRRISFHPLGGGYLLPSSLISHIDDVVVDQSIDDVQLDRVDDVDRPLDRVSEETKLIVFLKKLTQVIVQKTMMDHQKL